MKHVPLSRDQAEALVALVRSNYPAQVSSEAYFALQSIEVIEEAFGMRSPSVEDENHDSKGQCLVDPCPVCDQNW